ncbi:M23 family metallopeptidase [Paenibacillus soyae]|uniref:Peptidoglycan DD-metalloendopeptidase family protein n=1 Tax=Paenibacillus soyae TaxID=2969249 RepID=A0A9X2S7W5_9BACL|nr:M23 family metallopeptidase [Paenibacillus soyae]MCR2803585.1 peptidoglycan DD-metalloendopeptidase family protein [Paenibacillus soyae]
MKRIHERVKFVLIPDANKPVRHFTVPKVLFFAIPILILMLALCSAIFIIFNSGHASQVKLLQRQLALSETNYEDMLQSREEQIAVLESDLASLSQQAAEVEDRMTEIAELESELKNIAGIEEPDIPLSDGQGGEEFVVSAAETDANLATATKQSFSEMTSMMEAMKPSLESTKEALIGYQRLLDMTPSIWPADSRRVTSTFGVRRDPISGRSAVHSGLDLGGNRGDPIYAAADGVVTLSERGYPQGNNILIDHGRGMETRYLHLNRRLVEIGDTVKKGQLIGELGNTGRSTGPHLHYEVIVNGEHVDPMPYIKEDRKEP